MENCKSVGIIGYGFVGRALGQIATLDKISVAIYDLNQENHSAVTQMEAALKADLVFLCLPTPSSEDGTLDVSLLLAAAENWKRFKSAHSVLVIKSTVPPGFIKHLEAFLGETSVVFNPEFLTQRTSQADFLEADEIIVGGPSEVACEKVLDLYRAFYQQTRPGKSIKYVRTSGRLAELVKIVRNSYYATKISFMNEVAELVAALGEDYHEFRKVFVHQGRSAWVEDMHTYVPGPDGYRGLSGACLPKDSMGLLRLAESNDSPMPVLKAGIEANKLRRTGECYRGKLSLLGVPK